MTLRQRIETVTPEIAGRWLAKNEENRRVTQSVVDRYARDMKSGQWHVTGDPIQFGKSGRLLNGQHRLWACILADSAFETSVVRGIENEVEVMDVIDTGAKRSLAHALQINGEVSTSMLAAVIRGCWVYEKSRYASLVGPTHSEGLAWLAEHGDVRQVVAAAHSISKSLRVPAATIGVAYYLNSQHDGEAASEFWKRAASGENLRAGDVILAYRRFVMKTLSRRDRPEPKVWVAYNLKAMNLWRLGRDTRILSWRSDEEMPETWSTLAVPTSKRRRAA